MGKDKEVSEEPRAEILEAVRQAAPEGQITCTVARRLAGEHGVHPRVIGAACDRLEIKIQACELGCF